MRHLRIKAFAGLLNLLVVLGAALFLPAWTFRWWQAWLFLGVFGVSVSLITAYLARHDPALLERRVRAGPVAETRRLQQVVQSLASLAFLAIFIVAAIDHRRGWSRVPLVVVVLGDALVGLGLWSVFRVFRESTFTAATIEVAPEQCVISTGPYSVVRHPMYAGALGMLAGVPLALASWWALLGIVPMIAVIVLRLLDEERFLARELAGYEAYRARVKFRLVPGIW
jgi:protein-S-isoprenylcysteine O-methyltransferase Ste14